MKNAAFGMFLGVLLTGAVWWSVSTLSNSSASARTPGALPEEYGEMHDMRGLDPAATRSIEAFKDIAAALDAGKMTGVRENALAIADFFAPMNAQIRESALALSEDTEVEAARAHFRELTQAFQSPPVPQGTTAYEL